MKYILFPALILLSGCQSTLLPQNDATNTHLPPEKIANTAEINQALLADESIDVIHPVDDIAFSLKDDTLKSNNDVGSAYERSKRLIFHKTIVFFFNAIGTLNTLVT